LLLDPIVCPPLSLPKLAALRDHKVRRSWFRCARSLDYSLARETRTSDWRCLMIMIAQEWLQICDRAINA
jgi:hypothetical protein